MHRLISKIIYFVARLPHVCRPAQIYNSRVHSNSVVQSGSQFINSSLDSYSFVGYDCSVNNATIGKFCSIASNVLIGPSEHSLHMISTSPCFFEYTDIIKKKFAYLPRPPLSSTTIGHDVWIGDGASIKSGINVGVGAVIGMKSVVTKDVPPYAIVAGNPARLIRYRFDSYTRCLLLESCWWDLPEDALRKYSSLFSDDPYAFAQSIIKDTYFE